MLKVAPTVLPAALLAAALQSCGFLPQPSALPEQAPPALPTSTAALPSATTTPLPTNTATPSIGPVTACTPPDLDAYVAAVSPSLDQLVLAAQEATQLQALPPDRIIALVETAAGVQDQLSTVQPPECLRDAHLAAITSATLLSQGLGSIASGAYPAAEEDLRGSLEQAAQALAVIGMQYWGQAPTAATSP